MKPIILSSRDFHVEIDPIHGGVTCLRHPQDPHRMNWVCAPPEIEWIMRSQSWGLGYIGLCQVGFLGRSHWDQVTEITADETSCTSLYALRGMDVRVTRTLTDTGEFQEQYQFTSRLTYLHGCGGENASFGIYTPWNDNYPSSEECVVRRCNAHLWPEGDFGWVCATRMGGEPRHLGLVQTSGALRSYSIEGRSASVGSNVRGVISVHPVHQLWQPGESHSLGWSLFWHEGWDDFFQKIDRRPNFIRIEADRTTWTQGETVNLRVVGTPAETPTIEVNGQALLTGGTDRSTIQFLAEKTGDFVVELSCQGRKARFVGQVILPVAELMRHRAEFIIQRQQYNQPGDPLDGALMVYDNVADKIAVEERCSWADFGEGRERLGMGVFLAQLLQRGDHAELRKGVERYYQFVREHLQDADGNVLGRVGGDTHRLYNFPFSMSFYLEMYRLTGDTEALTNCLRTVRAYYARNNEPARLLLDSHPNARPHPGSRPGGWAKDAPKCWRFLRRMPR